jgi:hypothetical protein
MHISLSFWRKDNPEIELEGDTFKCQYVLLMNNNSNSFLGTINPFFKN